MGTFYIACEICSHADRTKVVRIPKMLFAIIRVKGVHTTDEVVFAQEGDLPLLGARTLEGLNLRVDSRSKKLVASGPLPAALTIP